ncbi:hypothetical protein EYF88_06785 [Paracoccus sediminis]|uniref:Uncharacterized protein n=1 Tax=Paracoccus sediminis TaxID=1214787 RepID=A0A238W2J0_9RHOB|nr:hypothetical protein [Paracoccus sediminis]TBN51490.1 hypothetical protein EYF88_06785 [Paracoccus sediminis]SNR40343.1 hypothetical protein SAMN06265378_103268 [Paracoccus sediminis]
MAMRFESHGVAAGCWIGALASDTPPAGLVVLHRGQVVARAALRDAGPGVWLVAADLPAAVIDTGLHALLLVVSDGDGNPAGPASQVLSSLALIAGAVAGDDLLAEVAQLRAELDLLKREFRRLAAGG